MSCELCKLVEGGGVVTRFYYQDGKIAIVDCLTCKIPMVVFKKHGEASEDERRKATAVVDTLFGYESIRKEGRRILDHEHWHIVGAKTKSLNPGGKF